MKPGDKVKFTKKYEGWDPLFDLPKGEIFTIEAIFEKNGGIVLKEDIEESAIPPEMLEIVK